ncbi:MAG: DNA adenine methylase [Candidatus Hermodarchaeia archaeon]|jgi:DNA adenine methylase
MSDKMFRPPFNIQGGKYYLSSWILEHFPENSQDLCYVEPYVGAGSVLLNKAPSEVEAIGDTDVGVVQIFRALRDEPSDFIGRLRRTKHTESTFARALNRVQEPKDYMDHAIAEFILRRMSWGGLKQTYAKPTANTTASWKRMVNELPRVAERISNTHIFHRAALDVISSFDDGDCLCYCDPPLVEEDCEPNEHVMPVDDHIDLANALNQFRGKALINGRYSKLYKRLYDGWRCTRKKISNHKMVYLWMNY